MNRTDLDKLRDLKAESWELLAYTDDGYSSDVANDDRSFCEGWNERDRLDLVAPEVVAMREAIELALIYEPYVDKYKIKHTAYPKLLEAMRAYDRAREKK